MTFRHFTSLTSNVKEVFKELPLGPLTSISGDEGTYKSSIAIGARLALTGTYEPVGKGPAELLSLSHDPSVGLHCLLSGPDGSAEWKLKIDPQTGKPKKPEAPHLEGPIGTLSEDERYCILPTDAVRDLLKNSRGDRKLREAFIRRFGGSIKDIPHPFSDDDDETKERKAWDQAVETVRAGLDEESTADALLASLTEHFRKTSGAKRREITPIEKALADRKKRLTEAEAATSPELLPELEAQFKKATAWESSAPLQSRKVELEGLVERGTKNLADAYTALGNFKADLRDRKAELAQKLEAAKAETVASYADYFKAVRACGTYATLADLYREHEAKGIAKCRFCSHDLSLEQVTETRKEFDRRQALRGIEMIAIEQAYRDVKAREASISTSVHLTLDELSDTQKSLEIIQLQAEMSLKTTQASLKEVACQMTEAPSSYKGKSSTDLKTEIEAIKLLQTSRAEIAAEAIRVRRLEKEYELLKKLEGEAIVLQKAVMTKVARTASEEVSRGMLDGRKARLDPVSCDWWVTRPDGKEYGPFGVLCGTEKTSLLLGLVAAWTRGSPLRVAIFDDEDMVGLSTKGIVDFYKSCEALYDRGDFSQVIVVNNRPELAPETRWHRIIREPFARATKEAV